MHNPAPFDFVPFSSQPPALAAVQDWEKVGQGVPLSGRLVYSFTVKTPLHIVGNQNRNNRNEITDSLFLRRNGHPVIPGASVKGMLRAFMEALTNSWLSQATGEHEREHEKRAHTFQAYSNPDPVIPARLHPLVQDGRIDLASFLFGAVIQGGNRDNAFPSRLIFEDIKISENMLDPDTIYLPDVPGDAFMGGPKPRINNWWYFQPDRIALKQFRHHQNTDFFGKEYWGRKFYYHQSPAAVLAWYADHRNWPHGTQKKVPGTDRFQVSNNYRTYAVETIRVNTELTGCIYFAGISPLLLGLVILSLDCRDMAHKLGYGQAFGLGSVKFQVKSICQVAAQGFNTEEQEIRIGVKDLKEPWFGQLIDAGALAWLKRILYYDDTFVGDHDNVFTYPLFGPVLRHCDPGTYQQRVSQTKEADFQRLVSWKDALSAVRSTGIAVAPSVTNIHLAANEARNVAERLWNTKKTIHFRLYQEKSRLWRQIAGRG